MGLASGSTSRRDAVKYASCTAQLNSDQGSAEKRVTLVIGNAAYKNAPALQSRRHDWFWRLLRR
jgi:hypothetical protein